MRKLLAALMVVALTAPLAWAKILLVNGAGATFPYPIYSKWFSEYAKKDGSINFNYQSIGSGGGIRQIQAGTVDFGATDAPMTDDEMQRAQGGRIVHIPSVMGGVVPIYNLSGSPKLKFTQAALAGIFLGRIKNWNDAALARENPDVSLPSDSIVVVHRSDGSGTSFVFTDFLSKVSLEWKGRVGAGKSVNWPVGLGGKGNEGVAGLVKQTPHSIGYVELGYATNNNLSFGSVQNREGAFVECNSQTVTNAAASLLGKMPKDFRASVTNAPGADSYPISTFTWLLVYEKQTSRDKGEAVLNFLKWMLDEGQQYAEPLGYAPLPSDLIQKEQEAIEQIKLP